MAIDNTSNIANNPSVNTSGEQSFEVALATKMQLVLNQPMGDITTKLVNEDFKGDIMKIGDTVNIVRPNPKSVKFEFGSINDGKILAGNTGNVGATGAAKDNRLKAGYATFAKETLTIDKYAKYAFAVSNIVDAEGSWDYVNGNLALEAHNLRVGHNLLTSNMIIADANIKKLGTAAAPLEISTGDEVYEKIVIPMRSRLYSTGAIAADGSVAYGGNPQQTHQKSGAIFLPEALYNLLLTSKYFTVSRGTEVADERVAGKKIERILGLEVGIEPALDPTNADITDKVTMPTGADASAMVMIAGTRNLVTRAGKVLTPDSFVSHDRYAKEYHGLEIFGEKVVEPKAGVVAFVKVK